MKEATTEKVGPGKWVQVAGLVPGVKTVIHFVPVEETDYFAHRLPPDSLLGAALIGAEVGDKIPLDALDELMELEVLAVGAIE